jgi:hypothetical protein
LIWKEFRDFAHIYYLAFTYMFWYLIIGSVIGSRVVGRPQETNTGLFNYALSEHDPASLFP